MEYKENTEYWVIVDLEQLDSELPEIVVDYMGYDKTKVHTLRSSCFPFPQELVDKTFLIGIQLSHKDEYDNKCVKYPITKEGFNLAAQFHGIENIITDITKLKYKDQQYD